MWIETSTPLTIRRRSGDVRLIPGQPMDLPEAEALKLLAKAQGKVREAAGSFDPMDERNATESLAPGDRITWQGGDGTTRGPARVDFLHVADDGSQWVFVTHVDGTWSAINAAWTVREHGLDGRKPL